MRKAAAFSSVLLAFILLLPFAACAHEKGVWEYAVPEYADDATMMIGAWDPYFGLGDSFAKQEYFDDIAAAGFTLLVPLSNKMNFRTDPDNAEKIMNNADAAGLKVMVMDTYLSDNGSWDDRRVPLYENHPAFYGSHIKDEPSSGDFNYLKDKREKYYQLFPSDKVFFVNLFPSHVTGLGYPTYRQYVNGFMNTVKPKQLSYDLYPLLEGGALRENYFSCLETVRNIAKDFDVPLHNFLLSVPHSIPTALYRSPSEAELRWQIAVNCAYGVSSFTYYTYQSPMHGTGAEVYGDALISKTGVKTPLYGYAQTVNNEMLAWDHVYLKYVWQAVAAVKGSHGIANPLFASLPYALDPEKEKIEGVSGITSDQDLLMGVFADADGNKGFMVTNATDPYVKKSATVTVKFQDGYKGAQMYEKGVPRIVDFDDGTVNFNLESGEGKFLIPLAKVKK